MASAIAEFIEKSKADLESLESRCSSALSIKRAQIEAFTSMWDQGDKGNDIEFTRTRLELDKMLLDAQSTFTEGSDKLRLSIQKMQKLLDSLK